MLDKFFGKKTSQSVGAAATRTYKPVVLVVLDGFGVNVSAPDSTWRFAKRPTFEMLERFWPFTTLQASGIAVGLPWNEAGNSEIGHLTIGAGRVLYHHLPRIITSINDGSFFENKAFGEAVARVKERKSRLHIMGLFSSGSVHAYVEHLYALMELAKKYEVQETYLHLFGDGRDAPVEEMAGMMEKFIARLKDYPNVKVASIIGRDYSMDRDEHWDKIAVAYKLLTRGEGRPFNDPVEYIKNSYQNGTTDSFIEPGFLASGESDGGLPAGRIQDGDAVIFYNFREDSARELTSAFVEEKFDRFERGGRLDLVFVTMTQYEKRLPAKAAFEPLDIAWPLARVAADAGLKQVHIAETDKYAHVTYFLNGGVEKPFAGEDRILVPSPSAHGFDEVPEMSAAKVADTVIENLPKYDLLIVNFANGDMVGHTGNFEATVKALEVLDFSAGKIMAKVLEIGGAMLITADHGNAEEKRYRISGEKRTEHTINPVPCYLVTNESKLAAARSINEVEAKYKDVGGVLTDIAPTVIDLLGLKKPGEMTGESLLGKIL